MSGSGGWWGVFFLLEMKETRKRVGRGGVGTGKGTAKSMRTRLPKLPFEFLCKFRPEVFWIDLTLIIISAIQKRPDVHKNRP